MDRVAHPLKRGGQGWEGGGTPHIRKMLTWEGARRFKALLERVMSLGLEWHKSKKGGVESEGQREEG